MKTSCASSCHLGLERRGIHSHQHLFFFDSFFNLVFSFCIVFYGLLIHKEEEREEGGVGGGGEGGGGGERTF